MFSANENLSLRKHKRRVIEYVEETVPEEALDKGTIVMAMQVSCKAPGCVPLETVICIVFPKLGDGVELVSGLEASSTGGTYKAKVLLPLAEVTKDDVLDALPPCFKGGRRSTEKLCLQARDVMLAQIEQLVGEDLEGRQLMASYLQECLKEYMDGGCEAPEYGEPFPLKTTKETGMTSTETKPIIQDKGNIIIRRVAEEEGENIVTATAKNPRLSTYREQRDMVKIERMVANSADSSLLQRLAQKEHATGVRQPGCPCCDPDSPASFVDNFML